MRPRLAQSGWSLTREGLARLLGGLDDDADRAAEKYEALRRGLVRFFDWRGASSPEDCADRALDRAAKRLEEGEAVEDVAAYCRGAARLVLLEDFRSPERRKVGFDEGHGLPEPANDPATDEPESLAAECLDRCLRDLPDASRTLILRYYSEQKRRKIDERAAMAKDLRIPAGALRNRAQRIRNSLETCVRRCTARPSIESPDTKGPAEHI